MCSRLRSCYVYDSDVWVDWYVTKLPLLPRNRPTPKMHYSIQDRAAGQRDRCVFDRIDRSIKEQPLGRFRLIAAAGCCGIFVTEVKSLISQHLEVSSTVY